MAGLERTVGLLLVLVCLAVVPSVNGKLQASLCRGQSHGQWTIEAKLIFVPVSPWYVYRRLLRVPCPVLSGELFIGSMRVPRGLQWHWIQLLNQSWVVNALRACVCVCVCVCARARVVLCAKRLHCRYSTQPCTVHASCSVLCVGLALEFRWETPYMHCSYVTP